MGLYQVQTGMFFNAQDIDQLVQVLQRPVGSQETGKYALLGNAYATGAQVGGYVGSISRGSIPAGSVAIDTADGAAVNCSTPRADTLSANGFRVQTSATGVTTAVSCSGNYTINY